MDNPDQRNDASALEQTKRKNLVDREREHSFQQVRNTEANDQSSRKRARRKAKKDRKRFAARKPVQRPTLSNFQYQLPPSYFQSPPPEVFERSQFNRQIDVRPNTTRYNYDYDYDARTRNGNYIRRQNFTQISRDSRRDGGYNHFRSQSRSRSRSRSRQRSRSPQRRLQYNLPRIRMHDTHNSLRRRKDSPPPIRRKLSESPEPTSPGKELTKHRQISTQFASSSYLNMVNKDSVNLENPPPKLLILDLNGTLVYREKGKNITPRPHVKKFLQYIFESNNFVVMVWSSAQPNNVDRMVRVAFGQYEKNLLAKWTRKHFNLSNHDYYQKVETIKDLEKVWKEFNNKSTTLPPIVWDQTNTILIDDSCEKTRLQPFNAIHLPDFDDKRCKSRNDNELDNVIGYLMELHKQSNVSSYIKNNPYVPDDNRSKSRGNSKNNPRNDKCVTS